MTAQSCEHSDMESIGYTSYSGPTYTQMHEVFYCPACGRYLTRATMFMDMARRPDAVWKKIAEEERADRKALLAADREKRQEAAR